MNPCFQEPSRSWKMTGAFIVWICSQLLHIKGSTGYYQNQPDSFTRYTGLYGKTKSQVSVCGSKYIWIDFTGNFVNVYF